MFMLRDNRLELTILLPCLNKAETIGTCVRKARGCLARAGITGEVPVADNGSTDSSQDISVTNGARVVPISSRGSGAALSGGIAAVRVGFVIMGHADDSYDFTELDEFVAKLRDGNDLAMGNRFDGGISPWDKAAASPVAGQSGAKLHWSNLLQDQHRRFPLRTLHVNTQAIRNLKLRAPGMEFASEMVVRSTWLLHSATILIVATLHISGRVNCRAEIRAETE
jgi:glycosyltransferase involved in cell wall biosynthesis